MDGNRFGLAGGAVEDLTHTEEEAITIARRYTVQTGQPQHVIALVAVVSPPGPEAAIVKRVEGKYTPDGRLE